jgi:hypothetical protein
VLAVVPVAAGCGSGRASGGSGIVTVAGNIGPLRVGTSDRAAVVAFAGKPGVDVREHEYGRPYSALGYGCAHASEWRSCTTVFFVQTRTGRLESFRTTSPRYREARGARIGMPTADAERLLHKTVFVGCEENLYFASRTASLTVVFDGGHIGAPRGKLVGGHVSAFVVHWVHEDSGIWDCE